ACAIEIGLPLTLGQAGDITEALKNWASQLKRTFSTINLTLGCDCLFRKLEIMENGIENNIENELHKVNFIGFNTYGEQYNAIHVNQTLTGIVFGTKNF
ncbi:MAG: hypothetical protein GXP14_02315, partial [Gammaproteobacteria bacterium]|nr:hypothetical protein [Gammaproteobacteria bacterium]